MKNNDVVLEYIQYALEQMGAMPLLDIMKPVLDYHLVTKASELLITPVGMGAYLTTWGIASITILGLWLKWCRYNLEKRNGGKSKSHQLEITLKTAGSEQKVTGDQATGFVVAGQHKPKTTEVSPPPPPASVAKQQPVATEPHPLESWNDASVTMDGGEILEWSYQLAETVSPDNLPRTLSAIKDGNKYLANLGTDHFVNIDDAIEKVGGRGQLVEWLKILAFNPRYNSAKAKELLQYLYDKKNNVVSGVA